ncbi:MAG: ABC transporter ATP-binding protein [Hyphomicrobiales bacterium]|nr:ABC transporter ATP-binding protein [Hyphomicrobiales bacterium]
MSRGRSDVASWRQHSEGLRRSPVDKALSVAILSLRKVSKRYGAIVVADAIDLSVGDGEALGIIGPNGAGKTSLFNLIAGTVSADSGAIAFEDRDVTTLGAARRCQLGISRSFQIPHPFSGLTVFENIVVGAAFGDGKSEREAYGKAAEVLELTGLAAKANVVAGALTLLDRKRLEMARALATGPRLLLLDEIAGGLSEHECRDLVATILALRETGISIVWIEHIVHALLAVVDRLMVIDFGRKIGEGEPRTVMASREVNEIYLGVEANA